MSKRTVQERFWEKVDKTGDCWVWTAGLTTHGYGQFYFQGGPKGAHRVSYTLFVGAITDDLHVLHTCDNPPCVNPAHLFLGTPKINTQDARAKGRLVGNIKLKGETIGNATIADAVAFAIRADRKAGMRNRDVAIKYGVSEQSAWQVCYTRPWMDPVDGGVPRRRYAPRRARLGSGA